MQRYQKQFESKILSKPNQALCTNPSASGPNPSCISRCKGLMLKNKTSEYSHGKTFFKLNYLFFHPDSACSHSRSLSLPLSLPPSLKHGLRMLDSFSKYLCDSRQFCKLSVHSFLTCQREAIAVPISHPLPSSTSCFHEPGQPI